MGILVLPWWAVEANKVVTMMSKGWPLCPSPIHWDGVSRTALLEGFRLLGQIQLLQLLHGFQHQKKGSSEVTALQCFLKTQCWVSQWYSTQIWNKSVFCGLSDENRFDCTAICTDWISSIRNHLLKWELTIDRKFSHSVWVYCRSERSHGAKAERRPGMGLNFNMKSRSESKSLHLKECDQTPGV